MMSYARFRILVLLAVLAGLGLFAHGAQAQQYNRFGPANGILVGQTTTPQTTAAASSNVISLWSGTCNSTTFLRGDGSCQTPTTVTGANPTATIGLTAVNGSAGTFLRSDGAPALSQAIVPTWTGAHTFGNASLAFQVQSTTPGFRMEDTDAGTDAKIWLFDVNAGNLRINARTDAGGIGSTPVQMNRTGTTVDSIALTATAVTVNGQNVCRADGTGCPAGAAGANPTATIGLTAVNGSAGTFLRSDGAPALSQAITPVWTGAHSFTATPNISAATPQLSIRETDGGTDMQNWLLRANSNALAIGTATDASPLTFVNSAFSVGRTGTTVDSTTLTATTINLTGAVVSTGQIQSTSSGAATGNSSFYSNANAPFFRWREADQSADARDWLFGSSAGVLQLGAVSDAGTSPPNGGLAFQATRSAATVTAINFGNNTSNPSFTWTGSGAWSVGGGVGTAGQALVSNGAGVAPTWQTVGGAPGGSDTQVQYNNAGAFGGDAGMTYNAGTDTLTVGSIVGNGSGLTSLDAGDISAGTLAVARGGTGVTTSTGTGSVVLSASPTLTGTVTAATVAATAVTVGGNNVCQSTGTDCPAGNNTMATRSVSTTDNTLSTDCGKAIIFTGAGSQTFTLDADPAVNCVLTFINNGSASTSLAASTSLTWFNGSGTNSTGTRTLAVGAVVTATVFATQGTWQMWGSGVL